MEIGPGVLPALDLATGYLKELRRALVDDSNLDLDGDEPLEAMVAVPANASTRQRYLTLEAFARAAFTCSTRKRANGSGDRVCSGITWARLAAAARSVMSWSTIWGAALLTFRRYRWPAGDSN